MNINFEAALRHIDLENYDKAIEELNTAIDIELANDNEGMAAEYRCVLGELLANLDRLEDARDEFALVLDYCDYSKTLPKQRQIAIAFITAIDRGLPLPGAAAPEQRPVFAKPAQDKNFIIKQMNKRGRK